MGILTISPIVCIVAPRHSGKTLVLLAISMRHIKAEIINTTNQIGDLVYQLILRHAPLEPYEPTMYIDLEGVNLCCKGSLPSSPF